MNRLLVFLCFLAAFLVATPSVADETCPPGVTCVPPEDMEVFVKLLREKKCMQETKPVFKLDSITIITDVEGRVYYSGANPNPYSLQMTWCNYEVEAKGKLNVIAAKKVPEEWGWRFRLKFAGSFLFTDAFEKYEPDFEYDVSRAADIGLLWEAFYWKDLNLNVATGFRSAGVGVGYDLTRNFGVYGGYAFSWWTLKHNPQAGLYFSFW